MDTDDRRFDEITGKIIGCAYKVGTKLGCGFLEKCYENALAYELRKLGLKVEQQVRLKVWYDDIVVGEYVADLLVGCRTGRAEGGAGNRCRSRGDLH